MRQHEARSADLTWVMLLASFALGPMIGILFDGGNLAVGIRHKLLEHIVKGLGLLGTIRPGSTPLALIVAAAIAASLGTVAPIAPIASITAVAAIIPGAAIVAATGTGRGIHGLLDGQINLALIHGNDFYLYILSDGEILVDITDVSVGDLRDMYHAGLIAGQGHKCAELCNASDFSFHDCSYCKLHTKVLSSFIFGHRFDAAPAFAEPFIRHQKRPDPPERHSQADAVHRPPSLGPEPHQSAG